MTCKTSECAQMIARGSPCRMGLRACAAVACGLMDAHKSLPWGALRLSPVPARNEIESVDSDVLSFVHLHT